MTITQRVFSLLKKYRDILTAQEYRTLKGLAKAGDLEGAIKGLQTIFDRKVKNKGVIKDE